MSQECPYLCNVQYHSVKFMVLKYVGADCALVSRQQRTVSLSASESTAARTTNNTNETETASTSFRAATGFHPKIKGVQHIYKHIFSTESALFI